MALLNTPVHSTKLFKWSGVSSTFTGEIAEVSLGGARPVFGQVYDDAWDEGFTLESERTGREMKLVVDYTHLDSDGDVVYWILKPLGNNGKPYSLFTVRLYND